MLQNSYLLFIESLDDLRLAMIFKRIFKRVYVGTKAYFILREENANGVRACELVNYFFISYLLNIIVRSFVR
jgi:hypothetical protein